MARRSHVATSLRTAVWSRAHGGSTSTQASRRGSGRWSLCVAAAVAMGLRMLCMGPPGPAWVACRLMASPPKAAAFGSTAVTTIAAARRRFRAKAAGEVSLDSVPLSDDLKRALSEGFGYSTLTDVQAETIRPILRGDDMLVKARTGSGKTLAFLVPAVQRLLESSPPDRQAGAVDALVLSPVREIASQIYTNAEVLKQYCDGLGVVCMIGGVPTEQDLEALADVEQAKATLLVATPGRLQDHLNHTAGFKERFAATRLLVLDEADALTDEWFREKVEMILESVPPASDRQGMLLSSTFPESVTELTRLALKDTYTDVNTVLDEATPDQIEQSYALVPTEGMNQALWLAMQRAREESPDNFKVMVFTCTAALARYYAAAFRLTDFGEDKVFEIHSRKSQNFRKKETVRFAEARSGILFTSDASARGLDYPDITEVVQVGSADDRGQYIHRLGRTGRAGRAGRGVMILHDFEECCLQELGDMPLTKVDLKELVSSPSPTPEAWATSVQGAAEKAYFAWINHYNNVRREDLNMTSTEVAREALKLATVFGALDADGRPPVIEEHFLENMGLLGVSDPSLNILRN